ncbi:MAG: carboxylesterase family protein, partial [Solirubrobacteraceae bacterium]
MAPRCSASDPRRSTSPRRRPALQGYAATLVAVAASAFATAGASPARAASPPVATTSSGRLVGVADATTDRYLGVRYAVAGRWQLPQTPAKSNATVDATKPGPACAQAAALPGSDETASKTEDCLFLNVTVPAGTKRGDDLPVMVWWHGGGFQSGSGAIYDAQRLASRGHVAVVTVNYRLGIFGYLGLPGLRGGGDFGFADQIAATRWAKRNSRAFGGDPDRLT